LFTQPGKTFPSIVDVDHDHQRHVSETEPNRLMLLGQLSLFIVKSKPKSHYGQQSVGQSVLVSGAHLGPATNFSFSLGFSFRQLLFVTL
jgi:hypothetical protein